MGNRFLTSCGLPVLDNHPSQLSYSQNLYLNSIVLLVYIDKPQCGQPVWSARSKWSAQRCSQKKSTTPKCSKQSSTPSERMECSASGRAWDQHCWEMSRFLVCFNKFTVTCVYWLIGSFEVKCRDINHKEIKYFDSRRRQWEEVLWQESESVREVLFFCVTTNKVSYRGIRSTVTTYTFNKTRRTIFVIDVKPLWGDAVQTTAKII